MATIDSLQIEIQSNSTNAAGGIDSLAKALKKLNKNGDVNNAVTNLNNLRKSLHAFVNMPSSAGKIESLANSLKSLKKVGTIDLGTSLDGVKNAMESLGTINVDGVAPQIQKIAQALTPLNNIKGSGFNAMMNGLKKLDEVVDGLDSATIDRFVAKMKELDEKLGPVSTKLVAVGTALKDVNSKATQTSGGFSVFGGKVNTTTLNLKNMISVAKNVWSALQPIVKLFKETIGDALEWEGIAQRFGRGFGDQAEEVYSWVQKLNKEMGINTQQFMQYSSTYATMLTGFGVASKDASKMALGYMELTYDIWSGYNDIYKSLDDAANAVRSAIAGEVEPVRKAGFTIIESTLEQTAANHGLKISLEKATEAQKSYLRYLTLVDQAKAQDLVGNYAREMNTAEGAVRTFTQQLKSLAQTFGSIFLPVLVKVMPWLQAFIELVGDAIMAAATFFNIDIQKVDFSSSIGGLGDSADSATSAVEDTTKAMKELKNATTGIDELNIISPQESSGGSSDGGSGFDGLDIGSLWDDSIFDSIQFEVDKIKGQVEDALSGITAAISGFSLAVGTILVVSGANIPVGLALMALGATGLVSVITQNWNGMSTEIAKTLMTITSVMGGFLLAVGAILAFSGVNVGLGIALMAAGAVSLATAATINWKYLDGEVENTLSIITGTLSGALLAVGALFAFTGVDVGLGIALMAAGAVGLAATVGLNWDSMPPKIRKVVADLTNIVSTGAIAVGAMLAFSGANVPIGMALMAAGAIGLVTASTLNWDSTTNKTKEQLDAIVAFASAAALGVGAVLAFSGVNLPLGVALMAAGAVGLVSTMNVDWNKIGSDIKNVLKEIGIAAGASLLALGVILCLTGVGLPLGLGLIVAGVAGMVSGVALNWDTFKDIGKKCVDGIVSGFSNFRKKAKEIFNNFVQGVKDFLGIKSPSKVFAEIGKYCMEGLVNALGINSIKDKLSTMWGKAKDWWDKNVSLKAISAKVENFKSKVSTAWSNAKEWWNKNMSLKAISAKVDDFKSKVSSTWTSAKDWWNNNKPSLSSISVTVDSILSKLQGAWNTAKEWFQKQALKLNIKMPHIVVGWDYKIPKWQGDVANFLFGKKALPYIDVEWYKNGGFPDVGEMFVAREAGPELVGKIGNQNAVVNNDQIVAAVSEGVYAAVVSAMRATNGNSGNAQSVNVYLDGKQITASVEQRQKERGASLMGSQVYAY